VALLVPRVCFSRFSCPGVLLGLAAKIPGATVAGAISSVALGWVLPSRSE